MDGSDVILYIHGLGGGADSRVPGILGKYFPGLKVRTYDFRPGVAREQFRSWIDELRPALLIGESLGGNHALALHREYPELPVLLVSPAINVTALFPLLAYFTIIPGVTLLLDRIYKPRPGDRQRPCFDFRTLRSWRAVREAALAAAPTVNVHAFFGTRDHYRLSGIVSLHTWRRLFKPGSYTLYKGSHFMGEKYVRSILVQKIRSTLEEYAEK